MQPFQPNTKTSSEQILALLNQLQNMPSTEPIRDQRPVSGYGSTQDQSEKLGSLMPHLLQNQSRPLVKSGSPPNQLQELLKTKQQVSQKQDLEKRALMEFLKQRKDSVSVQQNKNLIKESNKFNFGISTFNQNEPNKNNQTECLCTEQKNIEQQTETEELLYLLAQLEKCQKVQPKKPEPSDQFLDLMLELTNTYQAPTQQNPSFEEILKHLILGGMEPDTALQLARSLAPAPKPSFEPQITQQLSQLLNLIQMQETAKKQIETTLGETQYKFMQQQSQLEPIPQKQEQAYACPHTDKKQYAKNMCHKCYHNRGKTKMAHACEHTDKPHYSNGMCQSCYLAKYYLKRKAKQQEKIQQKMQNKEVSQDGDDEKILDIIEHKD